MGDWMNLDKRIISLSILLACILFLSVATAYTGTGFTHNIPDNYYDSFTTQDILAKYNDTYLTSEERSVCTKVVDGDTIYLANGKKVRFVGVNTPERGVTGYQASKNFVSKFCLNKEVGINIDDRKYNDKYGRTLAVVIVDGKNLNEMLLKEGLAEVMYIPPSEFSPYTWAGSTQVTHHSTAAAATTNSIQSSSANDVLASSGSGDYIGNLNSGKFHTSTCKEAKKMSDKNKVYFTSRQDAISHGYVGCKVCKP